MSVYSADSLEIGNECSPRSISSGEDNAADNLRAIKNTLQFSSNLPFYLNRSSKVPSRRQDTRSNETATSTSNDVDTRTAGSRNAIIAIGGFADVSKRRLSAFSRSKENQDIVVQKCLTSKRNRIRNLDGKESNDDKRVVSRCIEVPMTKRSSSRGGCCPGGNSMPTKTEKKPDNALVPRIQQPRSYLECYHRRFNMPKHDPQPPENIFENNQLEQLNDFSPISPRDDRSEISFYRRIIAGINDQILEIPGTFENTRQCLSKDSKSLPCLDRVQSKGEKSRKRLGYRPYTIEEYRSLPIPKLDRSLGPDKIEMQAKREWLMRRRSYGNSVSARNRQQILSQTRKLKTEKNSMQSEFSNAQNESTKDSSVHHDNCTKSYKKSAELYKKSSFKKSKGIDRTISLCSSLNMIGIVEDSCLENLRQRHFYEKEMVDRLISQALGP